jgi:3-deoxy-7-phosphoheptulonate synthase
VVWFGKEAGIKIVTEVMQVSQIEEMYPYVDVYQVGARNTQNFNLFDELGKVDKAVMIKSGEFPEQLKNCFNLRSMFFPEEMKS